MICKFKGCNNKAIGSKCGLCNKHYIRYTRGGNMLHKEDFIRENAFLDYTEHMAYTLGLLYSDGYLIEHGKEGRFGGRKYQIGLKMNDIECVYCASDYIGVSMFVNSTLRKKEGTIFYDFRVSSNDLYKRLNLLGMTLDKSVNQRVPKIPLKLMRHFIRGLLDGDGTIGLDGHVGIVLAGDLAFYLKNLLYHEDIVSTLRTIDNSSKYELYDLSIPSSNNNALKFMHWIYKDANYYLIRKWERYQYQITYRANIKYKNKRRKCQEYGDIYYDSLIDDDIVYSDGE